MENNSFKSGYIGLVGRTNVGKSTLINKIFDRNIVITSDKAQTTRSRINCMYNTDDAQAIFVDCPGFFKPRNLLGEKLNRIIFQVLDDVDIIVAMVDFPGGIGVGDYYVFEQIKNRHVPKILILNKIDLLDTTGKYSLLETISKIKSELDFFEDIIPVSASTGENLEKLLKVLIEKLPIGPMYYPGGMVTDMPVNKMIAEIIREKLSANLFDELPHSINVEVANLQRKMTWPGKGAGKNNGMIINQGTDIKQWDGQVKVAGMGKEVSGMEEGAGVKEATGMKEVAGVKEATGMKEVAGVKEATGMKEVAGVKEATGMKEVAGAEEGSGIKKGACAEESAGFDKTDIIKESGSMFQKTDIQQETGAVIIGKSGKGIELVTIECNIYVEKKSHKAMIIGKSGAMLKKIGGLSRAEIEKLLGSKVFLKLWVKVEENWTRKESYLDKFGY